ncbi:MAG: fibronectin type III domain-containing protein [Paludibacter sp.]|jgi:hypothetical protein|nr:fibronectin type III domain-containing protein [Paludibacter sp.]
MSNNSFFQSLKAICAAICFLTGISVYSEVPAFDSDKPATSFSATYSQVFNTWNGTVFYNQWDAVDLNTFTSADVAGGYLQFVWPAKRILRSKTTIITPYVFSGVIDWSAGSGRGGMIVRAKATGNVESLQEPAISDPGFNREGIAFYPSDDGQNMVVQFSGVDNGYGLTTLTKINVPKPVGVTTLFSDQGTIRIEDFGTSLYVYYRGARYIRIDLGGLTGGVYTSGTVYDADMVSKGTFTGMEVETLGKVAIAQRDAAMRLYSAEIQMPVAQTPPDAPTDVVATGGDAYASVSFSAPANDGGSAILDYTVTSSPGGLTATGTSSPLIVAGLTNGTSYTFTVTARNTSGSSVASSASNAVVPAANTAFDSDKSSTSWTSRYNQTLDAATDLGVFNTQWEPWAFTASAADFANGYFQFVWVEKRVLRSQTDYTPPYRLTTDVDYDAPQGFGGGVVLRVDAASTTLEDMQNPGADGGFNSEGIVIYPSIDGLNMVVQFSGTYSGATTPITKILVPKPAVVGNLHSRATISVEDFGTSIYVYYNGFRYIRIDLGGLTGSNYTSGTVYDANMVSKGTFTGMEVADKGRVGYAARVFDFKIYSAQVEIPKNVSVSSATNVSSLLLTSESDITVTANKLTINAPATVNSITVAPGAQLELTSGNTLTAATVTLLSDATGTATLVDNTTSSPQAVTATVQQYVEAGRNWYMSIPLASGASSLLNRGASVVCFDEPSGNWVAPAENTLLKMRGYIQVATPAQGTTGTVDFTGVVNTGAQSINLTRTEGKSGFNLVGNPYPSYLDWNAVTKTNVSNTMWYRTKEGSVYKFYTYVANEGAGVGSPATVTNKIPPMQAFWVRVNTVGSGSIAVDNTMRSHKDVSGNILKAPAQAAQQLLRLQVSNGVNTDETVLYFNASASNDFDSYDAQKRSHGEPGVPEIFTQAGTEQLVINGLKQVVYNTEIPIGFSTAQANNFSITANEISNFEEGTRIILIDKQNPAVETDLTEGAVFNFSAPVTTATTDRFSLFFRAPGATTAIDNSAPAFSTVMVNASNQMVVESSEPVQVTVYNLMGRKLYDNQLNSPKTTLQPTFEPGVYFVSFTVSGQKSVIQKVIIR